MNYDETESFHDTGIANSDSEPELYGNESLNLSESGKYSDKLQFGMIRRMNMSPMYKYNIN